MTTRTINKPLLRQLIKEVGKTRVAVAADCSVALLEKLTQEDYAVIPKMKIIDGLCDALNAAQDELFPRLRDGVKAS